MCYLEKLRNHKLWNSFEHISLEEMKTVTLMNRIDTKYVAHVGKLIPLLIHAHEAGFRVQFETAALNGYNSVYYDTDDIEMYTMHHNRKLQRKKVRMRTYLDSQTAFLEIKNKNNKGRTRKVRVRVKDNDMERIRLNPDMQDFIQTNTPYSFSNLKPTLQTLFDRITLVNHEKTERITIDVDLRFKNFITGESADLKPLTIIELKQDGNFPSKMRNILLDLRIEPFHISKYCVGTAMTNPEAKINRFKRKLHLINKTINKYEYYDRFKITDPS